jgi:lipase ATG15
MYKLLYFVTSTIANFINMDYNIVSDLAKMSYNVYYDINNKNWLNTTLNNVIDVSISNDTVRAYLFTNNEKTNTVIAFKGTSTYWTNNNLQGNSLDNSQGNSLDDKNMCMLSSSENDKYNDNLFFSCCFYKQNSLFGDCNMCNTNNTKFSCCSDCYKTSLRDENNYINEIGKIIDRVKMEIDFNKSKVYFTGHSLGGMLASIAAFIYNKTGASFETPGDLHYMKLAYDGPQINSIKQNNNFYHFGHTADPIFTGNCGRTCSLFGYNINTMCHTGYTCLYDSKTKLGYSESIFNHRIEYIVKNIVPKFENDMPNCTMETNCNDCTDWNFN